MIKFFSQKNIFYYLGPLLFLVLSLAIINEIKAQPIIDNVQEPKELPRIIRPPIKRELCERIPLGETLEKHQQFQEEIFKYLMNFKTKAQTVFSNGLELANMVEQCDSKFCEANFDCIAKDCPRKQICKTKPVRGQCCIFFEIETLFGPDFYFCLLYQGHDIHAFRENVTCPGKDHMGNPIEATSQEFLIGFFYDDWDLVMRRSYAAVRYRTGSVTSCTTICVQGCGEFIKPENVTPAMWRQIRNSMAKDRVKAMCNDIDIGDICWYAGKAWYPRCHWFLQRTEEKLTRMFLDIQFEEQGLWVGYHCTKCNPNPNHCKGDPCPLGGKPAINSLKQSIINTAQLSRKHVIKIQLFERALGELAGRFETIGQSFQIWQRTRVGNLENCFIAKNIGRIDLCEHKLDYYICK